MTDEKLARLRAHDSNIIRHRRLLKSKLADLERGVYRKAPERGKVSYEKLANRPFPRQPGLEQTAGLNVRGWPRRPSDTGIRP